MCRLETGGNKSKNPASKRGIQFIPSFWRARQFQRRPSLKEADVKEMSRPFDRCAGERGDYSEFQNFCRFCLKPTGSRRRPGAMFFRQAKYSDSDLEQKEVHHRGRRERGGGEGRLPRTGSETFSFLGRLGEEWIPRGSRRGRLHWSALWILADVLRTWGAAVLGP
jgi:hypothetical protein